MTSLCLGAFMVLVWGVSPDWGVSSQSYEVTSLFTAPWFHRDAVHLVSNLVPFLVFGLAFERQHRHPLALLAFCMATGMLGVSAELLWQSEFSGQLFGASGMVAALAGYFCQSWKRAAIVSPLLGSLFWAAFAQEPGVAHGAHLAGAVVGLVAAQVARKAFTAKCGSFKIAREVSQS